MTMQINKATPTGNKSDVQNLVVLDSEGSLVGWLNVPSRVFADVSDLSGIQSIIAKGYTLEHKREDTATPPRF